MALVNLQKYTLLRYGYRAALTKHLCSQFDRAAHSDVTVSFGDRQFKCHRTILAAASDVFDKMLDPTSGWKESTQAVVTLNCAEPDALEAMLRYIYSFEYTDINAKLEQSTPQYHLGVYLVAHQYGISKLQSKALAALDKELQAMTIVPQNEYTPDEILLEHQYNVGEAFELVEMLHDHKTEHECLVAKLEALLKKHLRALMGWKAFRGWLEEGDNPALQIMLNALGQDKKTEVTRLQGTMVVVGTCQTCAVRRTVDPMPAFGTMVCPMRHCSGTMSCKRYYSSD